MRRFFLTASLLLVFLLTFLIPKASAATSCKVSSILPERATSDDTIRITVTNLQPKLYYTLSITNFLTPNDPSPVDINRQTKTPNESIEFPVSNLVPGGYIFTISGRKDKDIKGPDVDYCFNEDRGGFQVLTPSGEVSDTDQTGWDYDVNLHKCVQIIGGEYDSRQKCDSSFTTDTKPDPYCIEADISSLPACDEYAKLSDKKSCFTPDSKLGHVCRNPQEQIFCLKKDASSTSPDITDITCEELPTALPPCAQWEYYFPKNSENSRLNGIIIPTGNPEYANPNFKDRRCVTMQTGIVDISTNPQSIVKSVFNVVLGLAGGIALILIIISGYKFMTSQGNPEAVKAATGQLTSAVIGLLFIIFSFVILEIIGVDILQIPGFAK